VIPEEVREETDLVVTNCYPLDSDPLQTAKALWMQPEFSRAHFVAINPASDGQCYHGLHLGIDYRRYLERRRNEEPVQLPSAKLTGPGSILILSEHFVVNEFVRKHPGALLFRSWDDLIARLREDLPARAKVAVFPFGGIQVLARP
jgi:hypothetical protein